MCNAVGLTLEAMEWGVPGGSVFYVASVYDKVTRAYIFNSAAEG